MSVITTRYYAKTPYYDRERGEMRYGWQASMVRTIFGHEANRGGWNRKKAFDVMGYLRNHPPTA